MSDAFVPEADAQDQATEVVPGGTPAGEARPSTDPEAPEADALEQAEEIHDPEDGYDR